MTDHTATRPADALTMPVEDLPKLATRADRPAPPSDPWDTRPTDGRPSPVEDAFTYTTDRLDRLEHLLGSLNATVMRAGTVLEPLLTDGSYGEPEADPQLDTTEATPEDRRSTIAKRVARLGTRADNLADATATIERRVEAILDAVEL